MTGYEGNFFFTDWTDQETADVKYVNLKTDGGVDFYGGSINWNRTTGDSETFGLSGIGGIQLELEHEGASVTSGPSTVTFAQPSGLAFDAEGILTVSEQGSHVNRKIKKWC